MPNQNDMPAKNTIPRYDLHEVNCCNEREKMRTLAAASATKNLCNLVLRDGFDECESMYPTQSPTGPWCKAKDVAEAFQACANREAEKDSLIAALQQRVEQSSIANMQLAGAIAARDAEIADLKAQVKIERGIAERERGIAERMRKEAP